MKPASYWRDELCNRFVLNTKDTGVIEKFVEEIQRDASNPQWQPIESAPKDGAWFVAYENGDVYKCKYTEIEDDEGRSYQEGWFDFVNETLENPTHWMPLPEKSE